MCKYLLISIHIHHMHHSADIPNLRKATDPPNICANTREHNEYIAMPMFPFSSRVMGLQWIYPVNPVHMVSCPSQINPIQYMMSPYMVLVLGYTCLANYTTCCWHGCPEAPRHCIIRARRTSLILNIHISIRDPARSVSRTLGSTIMFFSRRPRALGGWFIFIRMQNFGLFVQLEFMYGLALRASNLRDQSGYYMRVWGNIRGLATHRVRASYFVGDCERTNL